ncbi:MAG: 30S ribosomal protein S14 [Phycisphaeraceae bacterium]|nr:30S ribosomal protein S14 [Phycisphaeraceae bacterium]
MGTKSTTVRNDHVKALVVKYAEIRRKLKKEGDWAAFQKLPRSSSATRIRSLCALTGRSRAVYRKFKISRIMLRELALQGKIPGMRKASW